MDAKLHTISAVTKRLNVPVATIRYYEMIGLLSSTHRTEANRRLYTETEIAKLALILNARAHEFSLKDIEMILGSARGTPPTCRTVKAVAVAHLNKVREKIVRLQALERSLSDVTLQCRDDDSLDCAIIRHLNA